MNYKRKNSKHTVVRKDFQPSKAGWSRMLHKWWKRYSTFKKEDLNI